MSKTNLPQSNDDYWETDELESDLDHALAELRSSDETYDYLFDKYTDTLKRVSNLEDELIGLERANDYLLKIIEKIIETPTPAPAH